MPKPTAKKLSPIQKLDELNFSTSEEIEEAIRLLRQKMTTLDIKNSTSRKALGERFEREKKAISEATAEVLDKQEKTKYSSGRFVAVRYYKDRKTTDLKHSIRASDGCTCTWKGPCCNLCKATRSEGEVVGYSLHLYIAEVKPASGYAVNNSYKSEIQKFAIRKSFKKSEYLKSGRCWLICDPVVLEEATQETVPATSWSKEYKRWSFTVPDRHDDHTETVYNSLEALEKGVKKLGFPEDLTQAFVKKYKAAFETDFTFDYRPDTMTPEDYYTF